MRESLAKIYEVLQVVPLAGQATYDSLALSGKTTCATGIVFLLISFFGD